MADLTPAFPQLFEAVTLFRAGARAEAAQVLTELHTGPHGRDVLSALFGLYLGLLESLDVVAGDRGWNSEAFIQKVALTIHRTMEGLDG